MTIKNIGLAGCDSLPQRYLPKIMTCPVKILIQILLILVHFILTALEKEVFKLKTFEQTEQHMCPYHKDKKECCVGIDSENTEDCLCDDWIMGITIRNKHPDNVLKNTDNPMKPNSDYEVSMSNYGNSLNFSCYVCFVKLSTPAPKEMNGIPWSSMKKEWHRLRSFAKYPREASLSSILLARQGFVYIGNGDPDDDTVMCVFCSAAVRNLDTAERDDCLHCTNCPIVSGQACQNICIEECSVTLSSHIHSPEQIRIENHSLRTGTVGFENRRVILTSRPRVSLNGRVNLQEQGFENVSTVCLMGRGSKSLQSFGSHEYAATPVGVAIFSNSIRDRNQVQSLCLPGSDVTDVGTSNRIYEAQSLAPPAARPYNVPSHSHSSSNSHSNGLTPRQEGSSHTSRPEHADNSASPPQTVSDSQESPFSNTTSHEQRPDLAVEITRLNSFEGWPQDHHIRSEDLAKAGYFYTGNGDCVRCFCCGGGLRNWEVGEDVWVEHARWFPKCAFLRQVKGQSFIDVVQELNKKKKIILNKDVFAMMERRGLEHDAIPQEPARHSIQPQQQNHYKICIGKEESAVFLPCGHFIPCNEWLSNLTSCPVCRDFNH